jgi:hypothetical protein
MRNKKIFVHIININQSVKIAMVRLFASIIDKKILVENVKELDFANMINVNQIVKYVTPQHFAYMIKIKTHA